MPQPVQPSSWSFAAKGTVSRPGISTSIAAVLAEWTWVERGLVSLVGNAFGVASDPATGGVSLTTNMMALDMMATAETMRGRVALLEATVGRLVAGSTLEQRWTDFVADLKARSKERNRIAHALWMQSDQYPDDLIEYDPKREAMFRWTEKDIVQTLDRIVATRKEAHDFLMAIVSAVHKGVLIERELGPRKGLTSVPENDGIAENLVRHP